MLLAWILLWVLYAPLVVGVLLLAAALALGVIRWINEHEELRGVRAAWVGLSACGAAMLILWAVQLKGWFP